MPTRLIGDNIHSSESVNQMTDFQFRLWVNLITYVDDYGRGDARAAIIRGSCFPLRERLTNKDIDAGLQDLAAIGSVVLYEVDGKPYLWLPGWDSHQQVRAKRPKYPAPEDGVIKSVNACNHTITDDNRFTRNPNQSESKSESESERARAREDDEFAQFWDAYPNHKDRKKAEAAFSKAIKRADLATMLAAVETQKRTASWQKDNGRYIPMPSTWLNGERWNDEAESTAKPKQDKPWEEDDLAAAERMFSGNQRGGSR